MNLHQLVHTDNIQRFLGGVSMDTQEFHWCGAINLGEWSVAPIIKTSYHCTAAVSGAVFNETAASQSHTAPRSHGKSVPATTPSNQRIFMSVEVRPVALAFVKEQQGNYVGWVLGDGSSAVSTFLKSQEKPDVTGL